MNTLAHIQLGLRLLRQALDVFVIAPSIFFGATIFAIGLSQGNPARTIATSFYEWANDSVRNAPAGMYYVVAPNTYATDEQAALPPPPTLESREFNAVDKHQAVDKATESIINFYWLMVFLGIGVKVLRCTFNYIRANDDENPNGSVDIKK